MFDIVVCSSSKDLMNRSIKVINKTLINYDFDYHIDKFTGSSKRMMDVIDDAKRKIYFIDSDMIDVAYRIRENDFMSIIIMISLHDNIDIGIFHEKLLVLDYITFDDDYDDNLLKDINISLEILFKDNTFSFHYNYVIYRIPYENINYIEKETNIKRCIIHAIDGKYYVVSSIKKVFDELDGMFIKSSQSCIINMMNVKYIDCASNMVYFKNGDVTCLVTNKIKQIIKEYVK